MNSDNPVRAKSPIYTALEIICVFAWFLLDGFWLMEWKVLTYVFSAIAISIALVMFWFVQRERVIILIACADMSWLLLNVLWAVGDLSKNDQALLAAKILFLVGGLFCLGAFYVGKPRRRMQALVFSRLRVLRGVQN